MVMKFDIAHMQALGLSATIEAAFCPLRLGHCPCLAFTSPPSRGDLTRNKGYASQVHVSRNLLCPPVHALATFAAYHHGAHLIVAQLDWLVRHGQVV